MQYVFNRAAFLLGPPAQIDKVTVAAAAADADNPAGSHILRAGLVLAKITASGKYAQYDNTASDGTQLEADVLVLLEDVDLKGGDLTASNADQIGTVAIIARVKEAGLIGLTSDAKTALIPGGSAKAQYTFE